MKGPARAGAFRHNACRAPLKPDELAQLKAAAKQEIARRRALFEQRAEALHALLIASGAGRSALRLSAPYVGSRTRRIASRCSASIRLRLRSGSRVPPLSALRDDAARPSAVFGLKACQLRQPCSPSARG
jgi:hypothetical protein